MLNDNYVTMEIGKTKHIALIAHDGKKKELVDWCDRNKEILKGHFLCGTGTTARLIADRTGLPVKGFCSGPLGGDQQVGAKIVEGQVDFMIFLWDPLEAQPHDPDVKALLRIAVVYDIPGSLRTTLQRRTLCCTQSSWKNHTAEKLRISIRRSKSGRKN